MCFRERAGGTIEVAEGDALVGYRGFRMLAGGKLAPLFYSDDSQAAFFPGRAAECLVDWEKSMKHSAPGVDCTCGYHAFRTMEQFFWANYEGDSHCYAQVKLWGTVALHDAEGYRAQYMRVTRLCAKQADVYAQRRLAALGESLGVPVVTSVEELMAE